MFVRRVRSPVLRERQMRQNQCGTYCIINEMKGGARMIKLSCDDGFIPTSVLSGDSYPRLKLSPHFSGTFLLAGLGVKVQAPFHTVLKEHKNTT